MAVATAMPASAMAADEKPAAKKTCDTTKVHTGPRGGKYTLTKDCRKVYVKKGR